MLGGEGMLTMCGDVGSGCGGDCLMRRGGEHGLLHGGMDWEKVCVLRLEGVTAERVMGGMMREAVTTGLTLQLSLLSV